MPTATLTESDRQALVRMAEQRVRADSPLCPKWLRRAIAERAVTQLHAALLNPATSDAAQAAVLKALALADLAHNRKPLTFASASAPTTSLKTAVALP